MCYYDIDCRVIIMMTVMMLINMPCTNMTIFSQRSIIRQIIFDCIENNAVIYVLYVYYTCFLARGDKDNKVSNFKVDLYIVPSINIICLTSRLLIRFSCSFITTKWRALFSFYRIFCAHFSVAAVRQINGSLCDSFIFIRYLYFQKHVMNNSTKFYHKIR